MRTAVLVFVAAIGAGCVTQRSLGVGQMASAVGKGAADINVFTGVMYQSQTAPPTVSKDVLGDDVTNQVNSKGLSAPWFEANANYGFGDHLSLNLHMSPAGIQPGLKITLNKSRIANIALLPQIGLGYASYGESTTVAGSNGKGEEVSPTSTTSFIFSAGLKLLISHQVGFFFGLGYDFMYTRNAQNFTTGTPQTLVYHQTLLTSLQHQIGASVGMSVKVGFLSIRPEIAFVIAPAISGTRTVDNLNPYSASGGSAWAILPGFGFALTSPPARGDKGADEDEKNVGETEERQEEKAEDPPPREREEDN
jgi:hypothetical protein